MWINKEKNTFASVQTILMNACVAPFIPHFPLSINVILWNLKHFCHKEIKTREKKKSRAKENRVTKMYSSRQYFSLYLLINRLTHVQSNSHAYSTSIYCVEIYMQYAYALVQTYCSHLNKHILLVGTYTQPINSYVCVCVFGKYSENLWRRKMYLYPSDTTIRK